MKLLCLIVAAIACSLVSAQAQSYDEELTKLSSSLGNSLEKAGLKTVAIGGFKDLQGKETGLGKLLVEDLSVDLVNQNKGVTVVDRANLSRLMEEFKLTEEGLVEDPEKTKRLKLAGIDAIILGTIVPFEQAYRISAKAIATDNAKVVAATRGSVTQTESLNTLMGVTKLSANAGTPASTGQSAATSTGASSPAEPSKVYDLGNVSIRIESAVFFRKTGIARIVYVVTNKSDRSLMFAYHLIDINVPDDDYGNFNRTARIKKGYKPSYKAEGEATDDKGQSYSLVLPRDAISAPTIPKEAQTAFTVEYKVNAEPGATVQIPQTLSFWLEIFAGRYRSPQSLYKLSVVDFPLGKLY